MEQLTTNEVALLTTAALLVGGFFGWIGRGIGFLVLRWWTRAPKHERANYLNTLADLSVKLRANGMTLEEVRALEAIVQNPSVGSSEAVTKVVEQVVGYGEPDAFQSNAAMKERAGSAYNVAEATLNQALTDLHLLIGDGEWEAIETAQRHWLAYRGALQDSARREYEGGTHAGLAAMLTGLAETERRTAEIRAQVEERAAR